MPEAGPNTITVGNAWHNPLKENREPLLPAVGECEREPRVSIVCKRNWPFKSVLQMIFLFLSTRKFVKEQKQVQEEISRMSSKAMLKVQDDIKNLKQLLSVSGSGLQRNALAIDKLKIETAQVGPSLHVLVNRQPSQ